MPKRNSDQQREVRESTVSNQKDAISKFRFSSFEDETEEDWEYYIQRFELELFRQNIPEDDKVRAILLLSVVGPRAFKMLVEHFRPRNVKDVLFDELKKQLNLFFSKGVLIFAQRREFTLRFRNEGESVKSYVIALRSLAGKCEFGNTLNERIRDQLVIGINNDVWQKELIGKYPSNSVTLFDVENSLLMLEQTSEQLEKLKLLSVKPESLNKVDHKRESFRIKKDRNCPSCGFDLHNEGRVCPAKDKDCYFCNKRGHFSRLCPSKRKNFRNNRIAKIESSDSESSSSSQVCQVSVRGRKAMLDVCINGLKIEMLYDPGATRTVIGENLWRKLGSPELVPTRPLVAYTELPIKTLGSTEVSVFAFDRLLQLPLCVVESNDIPLFGLDWCLKFNLPLPPGARICSVKNNKDNSNRYSLENVKILCERYKELFEDKVGTIKGHKAVVHINPDVKPKVFKARAVPFALRAKVESEIDRLRDEGIIEPVDSTSSPVEWASPLVIAMKPDGRVRLCADFRVTINSAVALEYHPIPRFEEIMEKLSGGERFTIIDIRDAYLQLEVEEKSRKYLTIATSKGYFRYRRLPFGINFAPALFQKTMDNILAGIKNVACYMDDIIVTGRNEKEHLERLAEVLHRLKISGIRLRKEKCKWIEKAVTYLGHRIDAEGIHPTDEHVKAIQNMPPPTNATELRSFLGSINYYSKFIKNLQPLCAEMHSLCQKGVQWRWNSTHQSCFEKLKSILSSSDTLVHYREDFPLIVCTDASEKGVGAVLFHKYPDGTERPVMFASRKLTPAESRYSSIDRESLALIFGVTRLHQYIYGREFILRTDHKPLLRIMGEKYEIPKTTANRLTRWALILAAYRYKLEYVDSSANAPADVLSRLPQETKVTEVQANEESDHVLNIRLEEIPVTKRKLIKEMAADKELGKVCKYVNEGWPEKKNLDQTFNTYYEKREELSVEEGILLWNGRIIAPKALRKEFMIMLHEGHPGIGAMRSLAQMYVWWPRINSDIEEFIKKCVACQESKPKGVEVPIHSWNIPSEPWSRLHIDFAGPFEGKNWLIVVDAYSKWLEVIQMRAITANRTIDILRGLFVRYGIPKHIVSDNGPQFTSWEFKKFCCDNNIIHIKSAPYHPRTNGLAERCVRTFKDRMRASRNTSKPLELRLHQFLLSYRNTPHSSTGRAPAELLLGHKLRTKLDLLKPDVKRNLETAQIKQAYYKDRRTKPRFFAEGQEVWVWDARNRKYTEGRVVRKTGKWSYRVEIDGREERRHADQLRRR